MCTRNEVNFSKGTPGNLVSNRLPGFAKLFLGMYHGIFFCIAFVPVANVVALAAEGGGEV